MMPLNATVERLPLHINLNHLANWKFSIIASVDEGMKQTSRNAANGMFPRLHEEYVANTFRSNASWWWRWL